MAVHRPALTWSKSRAGTLEECPRRYYFNYYGWLGWDEPDADPRRREIFLLKHVRSRWVWVGEVVHDVVEGVLRDVRAGRRPPEVEDLLPRVRARMREEFRASRARRFRDEPRPKSLALFEHEYGLKVDDEQWRRIAEQAGSCLERFFRGSGWARVAALDPARDWLELEDLTGFELDGVKVWVKLDFAHREGGEAVVVDWKTGKSNADNRLQFGCYILYGTERWELDADRVRGLEVNLATGKEREHRFSKSDLDEVRETIRASIRRMKELLSDPERNLAVEEDFPVQPQARRCSSCNFLRVCPEGASLAVLEESARRARTGA